MNPQHINQRADLIAQFGNACQQCGYDRCQRALHFHHRDPTQKADASKRQSYAVPAEVAAHPDRFEVLCANCHIERHDALDRARAVFMACEACGRQFKVKPIDLRRVRKRFCSKPCQFGHPDIGTGDELGRFWHYVDKSGDCWNWTGTATASRNGVFSKQSASGEWSSVSARRYAWELLVGPIPEHRRLRSRCQNPSCVNPDHSGIKGSG